MALVFVAQGLQVLRQWRQPGFAEGRGIAAALAELLQDGGGIGRQPLHHAVEHAARHAGVEIRPGAEAREAVDRHQPDAARRQLAQQSKHAHRVTNGDDRAIDLREAGRPEVAGVGDQVGPIAQRGA